MFLKFNFKNNFSESIVCPVLVNEEDKLKKLSFKENDFLHQNHIYVQSPQRVVLIVLIVLTECMKTLKNHVTWL